MWNTLSASDLGVLTRLYREAIDSNPEDAGAFAGMTIALITGGLFGNITTSSSGAAARFALQQATAVDPERAEVRTARAWVRLVLDRDWQGARCDFDAALVQRRFFAPAVVGRALLHIADGKLDDAAASLHDFTAQYPLSAPAMIIRCWVEYLAGDAAAARYLIAQVRRAGVTGFLLDALEALAIIDPNVPDGSIQPLQALLARWPAHCPLHCLLQGAIGYCYAVGGREQDALNILHSLTDSAAGRDTEVAYSRALIALGLNDITAAVHWLKESDYSGSLWSLGFAVDPLLASLRSTPEYQSIAKAFGRRAPEASTVQLACVS
jgi:tetratricopeptide (TPR) repeat protein